MKKSILLAITVFVLLLPFTAQAEFIENFHADIDIEKYGLMTVTETIEYNFEDELRHGIYRYIPETFFGNTTFTSVTDENGTPYQFLDTSDFDSASIRIGDPNETISGPHTYIITYNVQNEISFFEDHTELYWNVNGTEWEVPINHVSATITFPKAIDESELQKTCFTGRLFDEGIDCTYSTQTTDTQTIFEFESLRPFDAYDNLTIVAGVPRRVIFEPWAYRWHAYEARTFKEKIQDEWYFILLALIAAVGAFKLWKRYGDDPAPKAPVVAHYTPPDNLTAAEMELIYRGWATRRVVTATLFELGVKGILKIEKTKSNLTFHKLRTPTDKELKPFQKYVFDKVFSKTTKNTRTLSSMKYDMKDYSSKQFELIKGLKKYFSTTPSSIYLFLFLLVGMFGFGGSLALIAIFDYAGFFALPVSIVIFITGFFMSQKTIHGVETTQAIKGFKKYLSVAEKDRIKFHNPPSQSIDHFQTLLPFAVILGVEKQWSKSFQPLIESEIKNGTYQHSWLHLTNTSPGAIGRQVSSIGKSIQNTAASSPSSSGSGHSSSGFSGGSSGGGGGGGGGGSW